VSNEQLPRKELCNHGHPLTGDNLGYQSRVPPRSGYYFCKTCKKAARPVTRIAALEADLKAWKRRARWHNEVRQQAIRGLKAAQDDLRDANERHDEQFATVYTDFRAAQERIEELEALRVEDVARMLKDAGLLPDGFNELMVLATEANKYWETDARALKNEVRRLREELGQRD
jgi:enoyl reductase-like protein